jgi:general secretion pathway protein D
MPFMVGFDPAALQLATVVEGDFFKQGGATTTFSSRIDPVQGRAFVAVVRQSTTGQDTGTNGDASVAVLVFRAVRAMDNVRVQLLSATPDPAPTVAAPMPIDFTLSIRQP